MAALRVVVILINFFVLINSAVLNRSMLRRLLQTSTTCPKIAQRVPAQVVKYSLCPSKVTLNVDDFRIPKRIEEMTCIENSDTCNYCYQKHQCVQIRSTIDVYYLSDAKNNEIIQQLDSLSYNSGCVCADLPVNAAEQSNPRHVN